MSYQTDHLFLLVGGNPLPNLVSALRLLKSGGTTYLIHTQQTKPQAERLANAIKLSSPDLQPAKTIDLGINQAEAAVITQEIHKVAQNLQGTVGLNYTGGTKAMSVHAYRAIAQLYPDKAIFSYLDSNTQDFIIDNDQASSDRFKCTIQLSLDALFALHGLSWREDLPPKAMPILPSAAAELARIHGKKAQHFEWRNWCMRELHRKAKTSNGYKSTWYSETTLQSLPPLSIRVLPNELITWLKRYFDASNTQLSLQVAKAKGFQSITQLCEWLDGIWLEHYVLSEIERVAADYAIHDRQMSFHIQDPQNPNPQDKFEFDVAFMQYYQLFALSCTTSGEKKLCKQKLIEAQTRAQQLGGTEARVALVSCSDNPRQLRSELDMEASPGRSPRRNPKIAVFGRSDLGHLGESIAKWLREFH
jgi:hypothetical protein